MSAAAIVYECTQLVGTGKQGIITPDKDGYYNNFCIGAVDVCNERGEFWPSAPVIKLMGDSGALQTRIRTGKQFGENGHPKRLPGMDNNAWLTRLAQLWEERECVLFRKIALVPNVIFDSNGRSVMGIFADLKPNGELGYVLDESLKNRFHNTAFSIRSWIEPVVVRGMIMRNCVAIHTWDKVGEQGIGHAEKYRQPGLESLEEDFVVSKSSVIKLADYHRRKKGGLESNNEFIYELVKAVDAEQKLSVDYDAINHNLPNSFRIL